MPLCEKIVADVIKRARYGKDDFKKALEAANAPFDEAKGKFAHTPDEAAFKVLAEKIVCDMGTQCLTASVCVLVNVSRKNEIGVGSEGFEPLAFTYRSVGHVATTTPLMKLVAIVKEGFTDAYYTGSSELHIHKAFAAANEKMFQKAWPHLPVEKVCRMPRLRMPGPHSTCTARTARTTRMMLWSRATRGHSLATRRHARATRHRPSWGADQAVDALAC